MTSDLDRLVRPEIVGLRLAAATGDDRWRSLTAELITGGKSNLTYLLSCPGGELIFRRPPDGSVLATAHDMNREARVQRALAASPVPVADIVLADAGDAIGVPFYVMSKAPGLLIRDALPADFDADDCRALGEVLVDVLADLHGVDPIAVGLDDYGRPEGFVERQLRRWGKQWQASARCTIPAVNQLADGLARTIPPTRASSIVHGDYRLDNCLVTTEHAPEISAVLDWELSTVGDPLTDLGMLLFYWADAPALIPSLIQAVTTKPGFPSADEVTQRWAARTQLPVADVDWYRAFAHFKFAVIAAGIDARVRAGAMAGQDFGDLTAQISDTAQAGIALLPTRSFA